MSFLAAVWDTAPNIGGWFHILGIVNAVLFGIGGALLGNYFRKNKDEKTSYRVYGIVGLILIVLEIAKCIIYFNYEGGYPASRIPFQICTMLLFFTVFIPFVKNERIKKAMIGYTACVGLAGACFYYVNPSSAITAPLIVLGIQAFLWHGIVIGLGTYAIALSGICGKKGLTYVIHGFALWFGFLVIAILLNAGFNYFAPGSNVNFFYINSRSDTIYPFLKMLFPTPHPYVPFLICFVIYYALGTLLFYGFVTLVVYILNLIISKKRVKL
ncbi:MAG: hypothetical protein ACI4QR_02680 [Eubacteriales bacterium]